jgi:hypothetical protein
MSMFGFDPSGFMGGGFTMDFSNFDFSAYAPKKEAVVDPVDVVSDKTPTPEVDILEGAGTVAVTKTPEVKYSQAVQDAIATTPTDPIEQAIQSVMPQVSIPTVAPEVPTSTIGTGQGAVNGFDVADTSLFDTAGFDLTGSNRDFEKQLSTVASQVPKLFDKDAVVDAYNNNQISGQDIANQLNAIKESDSYKNFVTNAQDYIKTNTSSVTNKNQSILDSFLSKTVIDSGMPSNISLGTLGERVELQSDGTYKYIEPRTNTALDIAVAVGMATMTGGMASTLGTIATSMGASAGVAGAAGSVASNALMQGVIEGELDPAKLATSAVSGYTKGLEGAIEAGQAGADIKAQVEVLNNVKDTVNLVNAVKNGNPLAAITAGLNLADMETPKELLSNTISDVAQNAETTVGSITGAVADWAFMNSDAIAESTLKFADKYIETGDLDKASLSAIVKFIKEDGSLSELFPSGEGFSFETPGVLQQIAQLIADGASDLNRTIIKPAVKAVETIANTAIEAGDEVVRALPSEIEDWKEAENYIKETAEEIVDPLYQGFRGLEEAGEAYVQGLETPDINTLEFETPEFDFPDVDFPDLSFGVSEPTKRMSKADLEELVKLKTQYGDVYDVDIFRENPLLKNEFFS